MAPFIGSAAVVVSLAVAYRNTSSVAEFRVAIVLVEYALAAFALGHVFAKDLKAVRVTAFVAAVSASVAAIADSAHSDAGSIALIDLMLTSFVVMGVALAITMPGLRHRAPDVSEGVDGKVNASEPYRLA